MKDLVVTNIYTRLISDMDWVGKSKEVPDFSEEVVELHTATETINIVKHKIMEAIEHQDNGEVLIQLYKDDEQHVRPAFSVQAFEDHNTLAVFLFNNVDKAELTPVMRCLVTKCNCCDDINLTINPNINTLSDDMLVAEFMDRAHIIAAAWGETVKEAESRSIQ